jgi:hypothetical protein
MDKNPPLYMAVMPDVFGRGIMCFSHESEEHAKAKVKLAYGEQLPISIPVDIKGTFEDRWEWYGGHTKAIDANQVYDEYYN